ncbi:hypothetical protein AALO_G00289270 [Alosa alosa]|uniref:Uncharacterized protein n=1 Tax=Alosa alosa TaxID=278164 RepID=A0AAV6FH81_9TELE|nr:uncharacterized protein si:ch211-266a5.12 [Alosa alosa]KAG5261850.1 hypothetical protein AALO_G00289270 [Alosa alosa]
MRGTLQRGLLVALLLLATVVSWGRAATALTPNCVPRELCMDTDALQKLAQTVVHNISSAHNWRILLNMNQFMQIRRWRNLHGCVMFRVVSFYERVLREKLGLKENEDVGDHRGPLVDLMGLMQHLDDCVRVDEGKCERLGEKAEKMPLIELSSTKKRTPKQWAILQIQHLNEAIKKISEEDTINKALDELKLLHNYIRGRGVRKWSDD